MWSRPLEDKRALKWLRQASRWCSIAFTVLSQPLNWAGRPWGSYAPSKTTQPGKLRHLQNAREGQWELNVTLAFRTRSTWFMVSDCSIFNVPFTLSFNESKWVKIFFSIKDVSKSRAHVNAPGKVYSWFFAFLTISSSREIKTFKVTVLILPSSKNIFSLVAAT